MAGSSCYQVHHIFCIFCILCSWPNSWKLAVRFCWMAKTIMEIPFKQYDPQQKIMDSVRFCCVIPSPSSPISFCQVGSFWMEKPVGSNSSNDAACPDAEDAVPAQFVQLRTLRTDHQLFAPWPWNSRTDEMKTGWFYMIGWLVVTGTMDWIMTFPSYWEESSKLTNSYVSEG